MGKAVKADMYRQQESLRHLVTSASTGAAKGQVTLRLIYASGWGTLRLLWLFLKVMLLKGRWGKGWL